MPLLGNRAGIPGAKHFMAVSLLSAAQPLAEAEIF
jgi:hypothetical protein